MRSLEESGWTDKAEKEERGRRRENDWRVFEQKRSCLSPIISAYPSALVESEPPRSVQFNLGAPSHISDPLTYRSRPTLPNQESVRHTPLFLDDNIPCDFLDLFPCCLPQAASCFFGKGHVLFCYVLRVCLHSPSCFETPFSFACTQRGTKAEQGELSRRAAWNAYEGLSLYFSDNILSRDNKRANEAGSLSVCPSIPATRCRTWI
jgi:hypothetical protein